MTPAEYKTAVSDLGMNMTAFAEWLGVHGQSGRRWASIGPPPGVAKLLLLMLALGLSAERVDKKIEKAK